MGMPPRTKHIPLRTCVGCRTSGDKRGLIKVVRAPSGEVNVDLTGKSPGRGAYVCVNEQCIAAAVKKRALDRHLRCTVPPSIYDELRAEAQRRTPSINS